jgi:hypothetical protein
MLLSLLLALPFGYAGYFVAGFIARKTKWKIVAIAAGIVTWYLLLIGAIALAPLVNYSDEAGAKSLLGLSFGASVVGWYLALWGAPSNSSREMP